MYQPDRFLMHEMWSRTLKFHSFHRWWLNKMASFWGWKLIFRYNRPQIFDELSLWHYPVQAYQKTKTSLTHDYPSKNGFWSSRTEIKRKSSSSTFNNTLLYLQFFIEMEFVFWIQELYRYSRASERFELGNHQLNINKNNVGHRMSWRAHSLNQKYNMNIPNCSPIPISILESHLFYCKYNLFLILFEYWKTRIIQPDK